MTKDNYAVISAEGNELINLEFPLHPGYIIEEEIEARKLKKQDVARDLGIKPGHLSEMIKEKRHVSATMALRLEKLFGIDAKFWLRVQTEYDLIKARQKMLGSA